MTQLFQRIRLLSVKYVEFTVTLRTTSSDNDAVTKATFRAHNQTPVLVTFRVSRRRREMYVGHARLSVCVSVRGRMHTLLHGPGCNLG